MRLRELIHKNSKLIPCACGCGIMIKEYNTIGMKTSFKQGHAIKGRRSNHYAGGISNHRDGYILVWCPDHPFVYGNGYVMAHRLVIEQQLNCILLPWVDVHHINGNKQDNRIENLQILTHIKHGKLHGRPKGTS